MGSYSQVGRTHAHTVKILLQACLPSRIDNLTHWIYNCEFIRYSSHARSRQFTLPFLDESHVFTTRSLTIHSFAKLHKPSYKTWATTSGVPAFAAVSATSARPSLRTFSRASLSRRTRKRREHAASSRR